MSKGRVQKVCIGVAGGSAFHMPGTAFCTCAVFLDVFCVADAMNL